MTGAQTVTISLTVASISVTVLSPAPGAITSSRMEPVTMTSRPATRELPRPEAVRIEPS